MIPAEALLLADLEVGEIYQDRLSYLKVIVLTKTSEEVDGLPVYTVTARYYNQVTGLFESYTALDNHLIPLTTIAI